MIRTRMRVMGDGRRIVVMRRGDDGGGTRK